jgi:hypothetical protein
MTRSIGSGGPVDGLTLTPCSHKPRCRRIRAITARSSINATIRISREQRGHRRGSASHTFLISSRHLADGMRRGLCSETSITSTAWTAPAFASSAGCVERRETIRATYQTFDGRVSGCDLQPFHLLAYDDPAVLHERRENSLVASIERMGRVIDSFGQYVQNEEQMCQSGWPRPPIDE